jgi:hypothetical protein
MNETPYYLNQDIQPDKFGEINIFNYDNLDAMAAHPQPENTESIWSELGDSFSSAGKYVWDGVAGAWKEVKEGVAEGYSTIKWEIIFWVVGAVLVIWFIAKSGILVQAAKLKPI